jgi:hypothetical protein
MAGPFQSLPRDPEGHFRLYFYAGVIALRAGLPAELQPPVLGGYQLEIDAAGGSDPERWARGIERWERDGEELPLTELKAACGLDYDDLVLLFLIGLSEEEPRFGELFEQLQGPGHSRLTVGLLKALTPRSDLRRSLRRLRALGLVSVLNPDEPRLTWSLAVAHPVWDALRADIDPELGGLGRIRRFEELPDRSELILSAEVHETLARAPDLFARGGARTVIVRGRESSGRRTIARVLARSLGRATIELAGPVDGRWAMVGALATLLHAMPVTVMALGPGESAELPHLPGYDGPRVAVVGLTGGLTGAVDGAMSLTLDLPGPEERRRHWSAALGHRPGADVVRQYRMTSGNIRRIARLARSQAALAGHAEPRPVDIRMAARTVHGQLLDTLAERLPPADGWELLALRSETDRELRLLERRCREREQLADSGGPALRGQLGAGVRALFSGPSGTGKTLAARVLAGRLGLDAYRLSLASVVDKYLGETEKNLERAFAHAEAANAVLLLDEGDALLTQRTAVHTSNDRYANLETNYLLQRLESFEGILLVTSNAGERIDAAFRRRLDVIVDFRAPEPRERLRILELHLPPDHVIDYGTLETIAVRCELTGGQLRNAVLHAELLALEAGSRVDGGKLEEGVRREYRKSGSMCPLPQPLGAAYA